MIGMNQSGERVEHEGRPRGRSPQRNVKCELTRSRNDILYRMINVLGLSTGDLILLLSRKLDGCTIRAALREARARHEGQDPQPQGPGERIDIDELFETPLSVDEDGPSYADDPTIKEWIERNKSKFSQRKKQR